MEKKIVLGLGKTITNKKFYLVKDEITGKYFFCENNANNIHCGHLFDNHKELLNYLVNFHVKNENPCPKCNQTKTIQKKLKKVNSIQQKKTISVKVDQIGNVNDPDVILNTEQIAAAFENDEPFFYMIPEYVEEFSSDCILENDRILKIKCDENELKTGAEMIVIDENLKKKISVPIVVKIFNITKSEEVDEEFVDEEDGYYYKKKSENYWVCRDPLMAETIIGAKVSNLRLNKTSPQFPIYFSIFGCETEKRYGRQLGISEDLIMLIEKQDFSLYTDSKLVIHVKNSINNNPNSLPSFFNNESNVFGNNESMELLSHLLYQSLIAVSVMQEYGIMHTDLHSGNVFIRKFKIDDEWDKDLINCDFLEYNVNGIPYYLESRKFFVCFIDFDIAEIFQHGKSKKTLRNVFTNKEEMPAEFLPGFDTIFIIYTIALYWYNINPDNYSTGGYVTNHFFHVLFLKIIDILEKNMNKNEPSELLKREFYQLDQLKEIVDELNYNEEYDDDDDDDSEKSSDEVLLDFFKQLNKSKFFTRNVRPTVKNSGDDDDDNDTNILCKYLEPKQLINELSMNSEKKQKIQTLSAKRKVSELEEIDVQTIFNNYLKKPENKKKVVFISKV